MIEVATVEAVLLPKVQNPGFANTILNGRLVGPLDKGYWNFWESIANNYELTIEECANKPLDERLTVVILSILDCWRVMADLFEFFKILYGFEVFEEQFIFRRHKSNTRGHSIKSWRDRFNVFKYSFSNRVIKHWK